MKSDFIKVLRGETPSRVPVWFMRQAGRYLPEYRQLREKYSMYELVTTPDLATEVTLMPFTYLDLDAAILFSDLLVILWGFGIEFSWSKGEGPKLSPGNGIPLKSFTLTPFHHLEKTIQTLVGQLDVPLIGFTAGPFTLLSYCIEQQYKRDFPKTRRFIYEKPETWHTLMRTISAGIRDFLKFQVEAGCQAVMLFDSWGGTLDEAMYRKFVFPYTESILEAFREVPTIYFALHAHHLLNTINTYSCQAIGVDWRVPLKKAFETLGARHAIQGNLDPAIVFASHDEREKALREINSIREGHANYIFNFGHGVLQQTPVDVLQHIVEEVHSWSV